MYSRHNRRVQVNLVKTHDLNIGGAGNYFANVSTAEEKWSIWLKSSKPQLVFESILKYILPGLQ